jgi:TatD DNase family protein
VFPPHFDLAEEYKLPMYLHSRNTKGDFTRIVRENRHRFSTGVVHSFTGDLEELNDLIAMDLFIGVNGCSLKT